MNKANYWCIYRFAWSNVMADDDDIAATVADQISPFHLVVFFSLLRSRAIFLHQ